MKILKDGFRADMERIKRELTTLRGVSIHVGILGDAGGDILMIAGVHEYGATISAKNVKHLAIPLNMEAKNAGSPRKFNDLRFIPISPGYGFLVRDRKHPQKAPGRKRQEKHDAKKHPSGGEEDPRPNEDYEWMYTLIRKVRVAGIENPQNVGGTASRIEIAFGENMPTETLEASTAYYAKIGGKAVVEITTGEEVPVDCTGLAKLFAGTSFEEDGVKFTAAVDDNTVTYTSTTRTAVSGYAESISLYKDADCFEDMGLSGAVVSVSVGKADTTKAENLIAAIEDLRDHNDDWYFILTDVTDPVCVTALCKWAESTEPTEAALGAGVEDHRKFYFGQTNDKEYVNEYGRSVVTYADNLAEWADAAWVGSVGPFWPESVTWKWKVPDGVSVADLRDSERDLLEENRVNFMTAEYKHEYMKNGICGDGNFIDNVLGADYITHQIRENLYEIFIANKKIAYTDDGFALVAAGVFAALNRAVELHIIATDPEDDTGVYTVVIPKRADATDEQARNRQMPDIKWSAQLEGAVHSVKVNGTLRVTLNG